MNNLSAGQIQYLRQHKKHQRIVCISRILILLSFLFIWEFTANVGIIDSFIFSSPSKIALCFWGMVKDGSIFLHMGVTLYETLASFFLVTFVSILASVALWFSSKLSEILDPYLVVLNSLPKSALAPLLIVWLGATKTTIIVAGMSVAIFGSILNLYTSFTTVDPGKIKLVYTLGGNRFHALPSYHQQYEGQHRPLPGGRDHRGVPGGKKWPWVSDHLLQPGLQDGLASDVHRAFMHHGNGAVCGD